MNEHTIFDKAKAAYGTGTYDDATLEFLFPQLKESKNEKIRKAIKKIVQDWWEKIGCVTPGFSTEDEMLIYLEKQKEQKLTEKPDLVAELKHHLATTPKEQLEKEWKELEPWGKIGPTVKEFLYGKPAKCSEENEMVVMSPYEVEFCKKFCDHNPDYYTSEGWKIIKNNYAELKEIVMMELAEQKPAEKLSKEEYVKKFKALCDAYEIKLPNREYDIYGLCKDLSKLFAFSDDSKLRGSDIEELEWLIEEYRTCEPDCSEHQLYEHIASEFNRRHFKD